ncbi:MAG TPA: Fe-S cluster assembly protein SufD [Cytophagaceae bacterium]|jgi:Fe-S cluster assembly protein SufD|nr:Fe-S cluster assembly protein SufD [Cytophagaceae bacterium]
MKVTTIDTNLTSVLQEEFKKAEGKRKDVDSVLNQKQKDAFQSFEKTGFPSVKNEEWKYTNLSSLLKENFHTSPTVPLTKQDIAPFIYNIEANNLVFINGIFSKELSTILSPASELEIGEIKDIDKTITDNYFARKTYSSNDGLSLMNTAFAENGLFLSVKKNKSLKYPVIVYNFTDSRQGNILVQPRNLIILEENTHASIVETFHTLGTNTSFVNSISELVLKQDSNLDYYKIQDDTDNSYHVGSTEILHEAKSISTSTTITIGGALIRNNLNITLNAEFCEAHMNGLYMLSGTQHVDNHTIADHAKPNCYSNELYKGIMDDKSTGVFNGKIFVKPDAQKTNAFQSNKNVLLSKEATVNTKPQLEIFADDVKCSHGATTGQLDEESLFYLRSRGIGEAQSKRLLLHAFANDVLERIKIESLRVILSAKMEERLK